MQAERALFECCFTTEAFSEHRWKLRVGSCSGSLNGVGVEIW